MDDGFSPCTCRVKRHKNLLERKECKKKKANLLFVKSKADQSDFYGAFHLARSSELGMMSHTS